MDRLRVTARDGNGLAEVTIDAAGVLVGLAFTDRIGGFAPQAVARAMMGALRDARAEAADRAHDIEVETMGPDSLSARTTADRIRQALERPDHDPAADEDEQCQKSFTRTCRRTSNCWPRPSIPPAATTTSSTATRRT